MQALHCSLQALARRLREGGEESRHALPDHAAQSLGVDLGLRNPRGSHRTGGRSSVGHGMSGVEQHDGRMELAIRGDGSRWEEGGGM